MKKTQEVGSAFRPAREADMMRRLVERHRGILPLDTVESIWRVIISTFTYVQAPFSVHADVVGRRIRDAGLRAFPFRLHRAVTSRISARRPRSRRWRNPRAIWRWSRRSRSRTPWWIALEADGAPKIIARLPFVERADHPAALAGVRDLARRRRCDGDRSRDVERPRLRLERRYVARALAPLAEIVAVPDTAFDGAALLVSVHGTGGFDEDQGRPDRGRRLGALVGPRRQPRNALYGARRTASAKPERTRPADLPELE